MVRVKSEAYTKAAVKAPRKQTALRSDSAKTPKTGKSSKYSGGNSYCPRTTPDWQKPITSFFTKNESHEESAVESVSKEDIATFSSASTSDPVPGCSKDSSEPTEVEECGQISDEESKSDSSSAEKIDEEESGNVGGCNKSDDPEM